MNLKKKVAAVLAAAAAVGMSLVGAWPAASGATGDPPLDAKTGVGETILLVVADVVDPLVAPDRLLELNEKFGEMQGFYADASDGYEVLGALLKSSADLSEELCLDVGTLLDGECSLGELVRTVQPITTTFVDIDALNDESASVLCRLAGTSCGLERIRRLLGEDLQLTPGASVLASGFRTKRGAEEFLEFVRASGVTDVVTLQVKKLSGGDIGLGQEPAPDGSGPLTGPIDDQESYQH